MLPAHGIEHVPRAMPLAADLRTAPRAFAAAEIDEPASAVAEALDEAAARLIREQLRGGVRRAEVDDPEPLRLPVLECAQLRERAPQGSAARIL